MGNERIPYLDIARVLAMLWIVCYWHLNYYVGQGDQIINFCCCITDFTLGLFMFLSGFFMAKYSFTNFRKECWSFYKKRLTRFYILFAVSAILLFLIKFNPDFNTLITTLTISSTYILPQPYTLWFLSMLASFYLFTPILLKEKKYSLTIFFTIYICGGLLHILTSKGIDERFFYYFPIYCVGLYIGRKRTLINYLIKNQIGASATFLSTFILAKMEYNEVYNTWKYLYMFPLGIISLLYISYLISILPINYIVEKLAYCSLCAYLFHRFFYAIMKKFFIDIIGYNYSPLFCYLVFIPTCLFGSYIIQYSYDKYVLPKFKT